METTPLRNRIDLHALTAKLAEARIVMLGESSHGTQEFYEWRRLISQELISRYGFNFIAVEGDWPPCAELNRYARSETEDDDAESALSSFSRWPTWMWANTEIARLAAWLRKQNKDKDEKQRAEFFGLDVYSLFESVNEVLRTLGKIDAALAQRVRHLYSCFEPYRRDEKAYLKTLVHFPEGCEEETVRALKDLLRLRLSGAAIPEARLLDAEQNARVIRNAERFYRTMIFGDEDSWNVRDRHMIETLEHLLNHFGPGSKAVVWAHNTHIGDYRATDMERSGLVNLGGLAREKWGEDNVALLGFGTHRGELIASRAWDGPTEVLRLPPGIEGSYEALFHEEAERSGDDAFSLWFKNRRGSFPELLETRGHRAVGVVYDPDHESGNYVPTVLARRYDGFLFIDRTNALRPLSQDFNREEIPETWPRGI